ncbi:hypothetical protein BRD56_02240 [Thermoplasmatales archaeon SW_10_69_26]|nr:MAG: hypothetical protein BRD56_02240 [Thermoplasmatales archaeon SW_10_69_26]
MRVLIVAAADPARHTGGAERVAACLAEGLGHEHEVTVLSLADEAPDPGPVPWTRLTVPLQAPYHPAEAEGASIVEQGVWHVKELHGEGMRDRLDRALAETGPFDVASVHNIQGLGFGVFDALAAHGIATVYTAHDFKLASPVLNRRPEGIGRVAAALEPAYQAWVRRRTRSLDRVVTPSRYLGRELVDEGVVEPDELAIVPNGVPTDVDHVLDSPDPRLTMYGALAEHKGVLAFVEAFAASSADLDLDVAGTGPLAEEIQAITETDPRIDHLGFVDEEQLATQVANSLATVVPSRWPENCPMVVLESLAAGTPVVHTARGGLAEICPPGELGVRLPEHPVDWNDAIETLNEERLIAMRPRCRKVAEQRYSVPRMVEAYEHQFRDVTGGS